MNANRVRLLVVCLLAVAAPAMAQAPPSRGRLLVTVADPSGGVLPGAAVVVMMQSDTPGAAESAVTTSSVGMATLEGLAPGRYTIRAEFPGFESVSVRDVRVGSGETRRTITLPIKKVAEDVVVGRDKQSAALDPVGMAFSTVLTREQIAALPDDPDEMAAILQAMSPPGSIIRVDGFSGGRLPPKSQIRSIRLPRMDMMAAQNHGGLMGSHFIDIVTQPGAGPFRASSDLTFRDDALNARNPFAAVKGEERLYRIGGSASGTIVPNRTSYSIAASGASQYDTGTILAAIAGGTRAEPVRQPVETVFFSGRLDHAVNADHSLRASFQSTSFERRNLGVGSFDLPERAFATASGDRVLRVSESGPLGRRLFSESRLQLRWTSTATESDIEAPTTRVIDAFTSGGAQRRGSRRAVEFEAASDLDYVRGMHSMRVGILAEGGRYRADEMSNYLGTFTFASLADFESGRPATYTRRVGDPAVQYGNLQVGLYAQDDYRLSRAVLLSYGLRYEAQSLIPDQRNFSPRATISWSPWKSGRTTLRAGVGRFQDWFGTATYAQTLELDGVRQQEITIINPTFPDPGGAVAAAPANRYLLGDTLVLPESLSANAGIDQSITGSLRVNAAYTYRRGGQLLRGLNLNAPVDGVRPDSRFGNVLAVESDAASRTHAFNVGANLLLLGRRRTIVSGNYTFTQSENNTAGAFSPPPSGTLDTEWGLVAPRHRASGIFNTSPIANLGVMVTLRASSGAPYTVTTGRDDNGDGIFNDRPSGIGRSTLRMGAQWDAALRISYAIGFGGRAQSSGGPGGPTVIMMGGGGGGMTGGFTGGADGSRYRVELYASAQNVANRRNDIGYSGVLTSPFFGQPTNVLNPRKIELGLRLGF